MSWWTLRKLKQGDSKTRREACIELGASHDPKAMHALEEALRDDDNNVRKAAAEALTKFGEKGISSLLNAAFGDWVGWGENAREAAAEKLASLGSSIVPSLIGRLPKSAEILGKIGDSRAVDSLMALLGQESLYPEHRIAVARALGKIGDRRALQPLLAAFEKNWVPGDIAGALGDLGDREAIVPIVKQSRQVPYAAKTYYNLEASEALAKLGRPEGVMGIFEILRSWTLPDSSCRRVVNILVEALKNQTSNLETADLKAVLSLELVESSMVHDDSGIGRGHSTPVDCSKVHEIARQELSRRGAKP